MRIRTLYFLISLFFLSSCSKLTNGGGPYTIKGTLLNNCEEQKPVAHRELYFLVDWEAPEEERFATTDTKGRFEYTFDGPPRNESVIGGSIRISDEKVVLCGISNTTLDKVTDAGVIYASPPREAEVTFKIQGNGYTNMDTVVISVSFHTDLRRISNFRIAGPFDTGVAITKDWIKYASSGAGTMPDPFKVQHPYTRRLRGTYGTSAMWQTVDKGEVLSEVKYTELLMEACENEGVIEIDLGNKTQ